MTTYVTSFPTLGGIPSENLTVVELRSMSRLLERLNETNWIQSYANPAAMQNYFAALDDLRSVRNDQAFELGITTTIPGT